MNAVLIYVTAPSRDEALRMGRVVVSEALAACANVLDGMTSVYHWNGALQEESEALLLLKTREELANKVVQRVQELHPYDVPAILVLPIEGGSKLFLGWIDEETESVSQN